MSNFKSFMSKNPAIKKVAFVSIAAAAAITFSGAASIPLHTGNTLAENVEGEIIPLSFATTTTTLTTATTASTTTTTINTTTTTEAVTTTTKETTVLTTTTTEEVTVETAPTEVEVEEVYVEPVIEYTVFKPATHYIHRSTCRWFDNTCYEIENTEGIESRLCTECNPDMEVVTPYEVPAPTYSSSTPSTAISVTDYEYVSLCNLVAGEYGSDWVSVYDKGAVVATVIHRWWEGGWQGAGRQNTIINVITAPYQYDAAYCSYNYSSKVTQSVKDAVTYALNNIGDYEYYTDPQGNTHYNIKSFYGDGRYNYFY